MKTETEASYSSGVCVYTRNRASPVPAEGDATSTAERLRGGGPAVLRLTRGSAPAAASRILSVDWTSAGGYKP